MHGGCRQTDLLEYAVKSGSRLQVYPRAQEGLMNRSKDPRPKWQPGAKGKIRNPGRLLEGKDSAGPNQLAQGAQHRNRIGKKHQDETTYRRIEELVADDLVHISLGEAHVAQSSLSHARVGSCD